MSAKLALCLLLLCLAFPLAARDLQMHSPDSGECPSAQDDDAEATTTAARTTDKRAIAPAVKPRAPARRGSDPDTSVRPPRWHSFLPGMFR